MKYCDTNILEQNWFHWIISTAIPELEPFREMGILWTKCEYARDDDGSILTKKDKKSGEVRKLQDPSSKIRRHCIAFSSPIYFESKDGVIGDIVVGGRVITLSELLGAANLESDSGLHWIDTPLNTFAQQSKIIPALTKSEYVKEKPTNDMWHAILIDIEKMCLGIASKFYLQSEEEKSDLANDALLQVIRKLVNGRLVYTPGKAPVFNLLTTTIYRCMYSIMNQRNNKKRKLDNLLADAQAKVLPNSRSLRIPN